MNLNVAYLRLHKSCGIKVGDTVKCLRIAKSEEMGWGDKWLDEMDESIGKNFRVVQDYGVAGFRLDNKERSNYPFFVLEKIKSKNENEKDEILNFVKNDIDYGCVEMRNDIIKLVEMLLKRIDEITNDDKEDARRYHERRL
jgi:hypothetical protein